MIKNIGPKMAHNIIKQSLVVGGLTVVGSSLLKDKTPSEVMDYVEKSPATVSNTVVVKNSEYERREGESLTEFFERLRKKREENSGNIINKISTPKPIRNYDIEIPTRIQSEAEFQKELQKFKNPHIIRVMKHLFKMDGLYTNTANMLYDLEVNSRSIKDTKVLSELNKLYKEITEMGSDEFDPEISGEEDDIIMQANDIIDSYNTIKGNYVQYRLIPMFAGFMTMEYEPSKTNKYLVSHDSVLDEDEVPLLKQLREYIWQGKKPTSYCSEFMSAQRGEVFEKLKTNEKLQAHLYGIYIKNLDIPNSAKKQCKEIFSKYNVMIFPSLLSMDCIEDLEYIEKELSAWSEASNGEADFPKAIVLNGIDVGYLGLTAGSNNLLTDVIRLNGASYGNIMYAIRHELMHENDLLRRNFDSIGDDNVKLIKEIMPTKTVGGKGSSYPNLPERRVRDYDRCKYREEFLNAGIDPVHINYAYTNRNEFLAVAAEGDMSRYSPEFKEVLLKLGMPEFVFNLKVINSKIENNCRIMDIVKRANPEVTDFPTLLELQAEVCKKQANRAVRILSEIFNNT